MLYLRRISFLGFVITSALLISLGESFTVGYPKPIIPYSQSVSGSNRWVMSTGTPTPTRTQTLAHNGIVAIYTHTPTLTGIPSRLTFTELQKLTQTIGLSVEWGDYDQDGDMDYILTGALFDETLITRIYQNQNGTFSDIGAPLVQVAFGITGWGDYDRDGDLDLFLAGSTDLKAPDWAPVSKLYENVNGNFTDTGFTFPGIMFGEVDWGDYDNDGDLDLLISGGINQLDLATVVYRNDGSLFNLQDFGLPMVAAGASQWVDFDKDGDLDIFLAGVGESWPVAKLYRNDNLSFVDTGDSFVGAYNNNFGGRLADWGDYDQDGDLDLVLTGATKPNPSPAPATKIYRNDGNHFVDIGASIPGVYSACIEWVDYDNDGDLDIFLSGQTGTGRLTRLYRQNSGNWEDVPTNLPDFEGSVCNWGDTDGDYDPDLLLGGVISAIDVSVNVYGNPISSINTAPQAPGGLWSSVIGNRVDLGWEAASDGQTPSQSLSYNLRLGTYPGGVDVISPHSNPITGQRYVPELGNTGLSQQWQVRNLPDGVYYWSVQAIDSGKIASAWAPESIFTISTASTSTPTPTRTPTQSLTQPISTAAAFTPTVTDVVAPPSRYRYNIFLPLGIK